MDAFEWPEGKETMQSITMPNVSDLLQQTNFTALDWVIVILYPMISLGIGLYVRKFIREHEGLCRRWTEAWASTSASPR